MIGKADVIVTVGARVDYRLSFGKRPAVSEKAIFIRVDADAQEVNRCRRADIGIVGNPDRILEQMIIHSDGFEWKHEKWLCEIHEKRNAFLSFWSSLPVSRGIPIPSLILCREIRKFLDSNITFLLDGGNIGRWAHMLFFDRHPSHWFTCGASGVVGWGLPGAVAAKMARPDKPLLLLSGDGSAGFTLGEIQTALEFGTPYAAVIAHDAAWGIVMDGQSASRPSGSRLGEIRFDRVAEAFGAKGVYIDSVEKITPAVETALSGTTPTFIHVPTMHYGIRSYREKFIIENNNPRSGS